ncbi:MAG: DNA recombination/repair protein RecA, partial [Candidatus Thiodiazotropha sp. (ex Lucinoma borealis)]|nr:DNA recombination/repair protein RecA [Candidatus Thiodiazotropha sp. (ex Lucinoma borealis)]
LGVQQGIIDKSGAWYSHSGYRIGQCKENVRNFLKEHPELAESIEARIRAELLPSNEGEEALVEAEA